MKEKCGNCEYMFKNLHESEYGCSLRIREVCDYDPACSDYKEKENEQKDKDD